MFHLPLKILGYKFLQGSDYTLCIFAFVIELNLVANTKWILCEDEDVRIYFAYGNT